MTRGRVQSIPEILKAAGSGDHLDPVADFGEAPEDTLYLHPEGKTPTTAPGETTECGRAGAPGVAERAYSTPARSPASRPHTAAAAENAFHVGPR